MPKRYKYVLYFLLLSYGNIVLAQVSPPKQDTDKVYRAIEKYSKKRKFTKLMHNLIFEPIAKQKVKKTAAQKARKVSYSNVEGKIIRNIKIKTLDPFGYSVTDTTKKPKRGLTKTGNALHFKTRNFAIKNILLIKKNTCLDSLLVKESERLIRRQRFVRSVIITPELVKGTDSVDVSVRVLDSWSIVPDFTLSSTRSSFFLKERNFLGTGHEFENSYTKDLAAGGSDGFSTYYTVPNIMNTFIRTRVGYEIDLNRSYTKSLNVERPFYSPYARWAAGMEFTQHYENIIPLDTPEAEVGLDSKFNSEDFWGGHSIQIFKGNTEATRATNFITTARFFNKQYIDKPIGVDSLGVYSIEKLYLIGLGISSRQYRQDKYVFNFDVIEDIASGFTYSITTGFQNKNDLNRVYFGGKVALGSYFNFGYLSTDLQYGTFFNHGITEQSAYNLSVTYFTNLIDVGTRWKIRQFVKPQAIIGTKRIDSNTDKLTLNGQTGIPGFNSNQLFGTKKLLLTFQTQGYSPWQVVGFRLNPFFSYTMGMLGQPGVGFRNSKLYSEIAVGIIISNDYLVFSNFQFSFSYFPTIPDDISKVYKTNSLKTYDFGLQDFEIGKPVLVDYR